MKRHGPFIALKPGVWFGRAGSREGGVQRLAWVFIAALAGASSACDPEEEGGDGAGSESDGGAGMNAASNAGRSGEAGGAGAAGPGAAGASSSDLPGLVPLEGAVAVAVANSSACALLEDGHVWCWGDASQGQLGSGEMGERQPYAQEVPGLANVKAIAKELAGATYAVLEDGTVREWGGQEVDRHYEPTPFPGAERITEIALDMQWSLMLDEDGNVLRWNRIARPITLTPIVQDVPVVALAGNEIGLREDGTAIYLVGPGGDLVEGVEGASALKDVTGIADGMLCQRNEDGVRCGQITYTMPMTFTAIDLPAPLASFSVGRVGACGVLDDGDAYCWTLTAAPQRILGDATAMSGTVLRGCAVLRDTTVSCWGNVKPDPATDTPNAPPAIVMRPAS
jgi:hypothetical protein